MGQFLFQLVIVCLLVVVVVNLVVVIVVVTNNIPSFPPRWSSFNSLLFVYLLLLRQINFVVSL